MMPGMSIGVNMLKADPRLWIPVSSNYSGFVFKPTKGWLNNGTTKVSNKYSRYVNKAQSAIHSMSATTTNAR